MTYYFGDISCEGNCSDGCEICHRCTIGAREWTVTLPNGEIRVEHTEYFVKTLLKLFPGATYTVANIAQRPR